MALYKNPSNGHTEAIGFSSILLALLFGPLYFLVKGVWTHAILYFVIGFFLASSVFGIPVLIVMWLVYALCVPLIMKGHYGGKGWERVDQ